MYDIKVSDVLRITTCKLLNGDKEALINECFIDSKKVKDKSTFIGIKGDKTDGSLYYKEALKRGASVLILNKKIRDLDFSKYKDRTILIADNPYDVLLKIAVYKRSLFKGEVIAITGSVGKTSTKNLIAKVLGEKYKVLKTNKNENSKYSVPLAITRLKDEDIMVLELGMSKKGEMHLLSKVVKPTISIITNVYLSHAKYFDSRNDILKAKLEILDGMENKYLILNNDNDLLNAWNSINDNIRTTTYGIDNISDYKACNINEGLKTSFVIDNNTYLINKPKEYIYNVLSLICVLKYLNIDIDIKDMLEEKEEGRLFIYNKDNLRIIDDSYNSSYESLMSSLRYLSYYDSKKIVVIGDILELGKYNKYIHKKIGYELLNMNFDNIVLIGKETKYIYKILKSKRIINIKHFNKEEKSRKYILSLLDKNIDTTILFKASNKINLKNTINFIKDNYM